MKKEIKFSLVYRDMWQSSGKYQPRADQLAKIAPLIVEMGCFARVETNGGAFEQVNLLYGENPNKAVRTFTKPLREAGIQTHMLDRALNGLRMSPVPDDVRQLFYKVKKAQGTDIARTFCGLGLPIIQGYGMTEASPIIAGNNRTLNQPNTVGKPFNNVEVRLGEGDEIQIKGPSITRGYWNRPDATADAFTEDGWFRTGDVGGFNELGLLSIKGRIKEIIVTSTGEKVPPADLEAAIETDPLFSQCYVIGENRPYLSLITVVNPDEWASFAKSCGVDPADPASLDNPSVKTAALKRAKTAAGEFPHYALPRAVVLTQEPWTIENGLITPTLKLKRGPLSKKFANVIAQLYATHG